MKTIISIFITDITRFDFFSEIPLLTCTFLSHASFSECNETAVPVTDCTHGCCFGKSDSNFMHTASTNWMKGAVPTFCLCHHIRAVNLVLGAHVQLLKLWCHWCSLVLNSVLTGRVMRCAGPVLEPGLGGSSTVGYSRAVIMKQLCSCSAGPV